DLAASAISSSRAGTWPIGTWRSATVGGRPMAAKVRSCGSRTSRTASASPRSMRRASSLAVISVKAARWAFIAGSASLRGELVAEVAEHVPPDGVDVIRAVLGVVELDEERGPLDPVGVPLAAIGGAEPGELDPFGSGLLDLADPGGPDLGRHVGRVRLD